MYKSQSRISHHLSWSQLQAVPVLAVMGAVFTEGISVVPLGSLMKTLPSRATSVMELHLIPTLSNKLFRHRLLTQIGEPYVLGTMVDQTTMVLCLRYPLFHLRQLGMLLKMSFGITIIMNIVIKASATYLVS